MSRRKTASLDLTEEQIIALNEALPPSLRCLEPVLESLRSAFETKPPHQRTVPVSIATFYYQNAHTYEFNRLVKPQTSSMRLLLQKRSVLIIEKMMRPTFLFLTLNK